MPGINVSALSGGDLRRLLKVAHARHDGLLADRLEWEIAARATSGGHPTAAFASHQEDDEDEPVERIAAPEDEAEPEADAPAFEPRAHLVRGRAQAPRGVLLVTLGAVAGSLLSAAVFWGLGRMDLRQASGRAEPQAVTIAMNPAATPAPDQTLALLTPEPTPLQPDAPAATVETPLPVATPPVEIAKTAAPARKPTALKAKAVHRPKPLTVASTERPARSPTLSEWLKSEPEEPIF